MHRMTSRVPLLLKNTHILQNRSHHTVHVHSGIHGGGHKIDYARGWAYQHIYLEQRLKIKRQHMLENSQHTNVGLMGDSKFNGDVDRVLLLEHDHVYTLGRGANEENFTFLQSMEDTASNIIRRRLSRKNKGADSCRLELSKISLMSNASIEEQVNSFIPPPAVFAPNGVPIYRIERGGEVTYHGPSQLVVYPLLDLSSDHFRKDLHWYLRCIEEVIIRALSEYGIVGVRDEINTGVWVGRNKIAAIGLSSARWITTHGFALNLDPELSMFDTSIITPCGIKGRGVTSIANELSSSPPSLEEIAAVVLEKVGEVFQITLQPAADLS